MNGRQPQFNMEIEDNLPEKFTTNSLETSWGWPELGTDQPQLVSREFVVLNRDNLGCANCQTQRVKSKPHVPFNFNTKAVKALIIWKGIQLLLGSSNSYLTPLNIVTRKGEFVWCGWWWTFGYEWSLISKSVELICWFSSFFSGN